MSDPLRVSAHKINMWMSCSLQAKFYYHDKIRGGSTNQYAVYGTCVHHALEVYNHTFDVQRAMNAFVSAWDKPETLGTQIDIWLPGLTYGGGRTQGIESIRAYHEKNQWEERQIIATEHRFCVPFGKYELTGIVDLLETKKSGKGKDTLRVIDFKTNRKQPPRDSLKVNVQFTAYLWAARQKEFWLGYNDEFEPMVNGSYHWEFMKDIPTRAIWYQVKDQREFDAGPRDDAAFMRLYRVCQMIERAEQHDVYVPNISGDSCGYCPYTEECGLPIGHDDIEDPDVWM